MADLLLYHDQVSKLTSDVDDLSRYSASSFFTSISPSTDDEHKRLKANIADIQSSRDAAQQAMHKLFEELINTDAWPSAPVLEDLQKQNERIEEHVKGLEGLMKDVAESLKGVGQDARIVAEGLKERGTRGRSKGKSKEKAKEGSVAVVDAMDVDIPTSTIATTVADADESDWDSDSSNYRYASTFKKLNRRISKLSSRVTSVIHTLEQTESSWMLELSDAYTDLQKTHAYTLASQLSSYKSSVEKHATSLRASLDQISDAATKANTKVDKAADETAEMLERMTKLNEERRELVERQKRFWENELPGMKSALERLEKERERDERRTGALEKAVEAFVRRPPVSSVSISHTVLPPAPPTSVNTSTTATETQQQPDYQYLIHILKPHLTHSLREAVKPMIQEVVTKVGEMVDAQKEEVRCSMWDKVELTWKVLEEVQKRAEVLVGSSDGADGGGDTGEGSNGEGGSRDTTGSGTPGGKSVTSEENGKEKEKEKAEEREVEMEAEEGEVFSSRPANPGTARARMAVDSHHPTSAATDRNPG
jgi:hypothetical protein